MEQGGHINVLVIVIPDHPARPRRILPARGERTIQYPPGLRRLISVAELTPHNREPPASRRHGAQAAAEPLAGRVKLNLAPPRADLLSA